MRLVIERQERGFLHGYHIWQLHEDHAGRPDLAGEEVRKGREDVVGIVGFEGRHVRLLETEDNGIFEATLVDRDTLEAICTESERHEATLFRVVLERER
ncbi:MAG TPA: hypothetical protein VLE23_08715 [Geminicoccaceae bacterium]|nr:hypothetical protein [Geminicoccaceae bacterium]